MGGSTSRVALTAAIAVVLAGCGQSARSQPSDTATEPPGVPPPASSPAQTQPQAQPPGGPAALESAYERVITKVLPSIVQITTENGLGSGIVYDSSGHIITNAHVVGRAKRFEVTLATGGTPRRAELVESFALGDLAVIKVNDPAGLRPAVFGDSGKLRVGQIVLAMGNPLGLSGSVTDGIVSALGRTVSEPTDGGSPGATIAGAIQTSAAINPGNSGGALVNLSGEVIGVPTLTAVNPELGGGQAPGIGFAIPSNTATDITRQIVETGKVTNTHRAALGVTIQTVIGSGGGPVGAGVVRVSRGGSADQAGIRPGDVIVSINGTPTPTSQALSEIIADLRPGDRAKVELLRPDGSSSTVTVTLGELPGG
ncbi:MULTISPECIES: S1C family serine protease [Streptosporangium]|uniref:S1-C subfamily serine protease n=1 Tax=Streptosporangium brasiliense TaxID=47480 RepID=A0ABT9R0G2_9ACTN|nr:trypsin-like peptidase domain-containing protein [Streptosporangium brasiliense]MDP9862688.1 S1-C subfamily serine protease [Streptosporangium brasiliense]